MKRRTDTLAQQYRIRAEHAQRCALEAFGAAVQWQRQRDGLFGSGAFTLDPGPTDNTVYFYDDQPKRTNH